MQYIGEGLYAVDYLELVVRNTTLLLHKEKAGHTAKAHTLGVLRLCDVIVSDQDCRLDYDNIEVKDE